MEHNLKAIIIYTISGIMGIAGGGACTYAFLIGITIPTVVEDFTNKLLLFSFVLMFLGYHGARAFLTHSYNCMKKVRVHWHLRKGKK